MQRVVMLLVAALAAGCNGGAKPAGAPAPMRAAAPAARVPATADLTGKVKAPASLLSNNGAGIVSNNGAGLISDKGGGLISDKGGGLRLLAAAPGGYGLRAATPWQAAGGVRVALVDAAGAPVGDPVTADAQGAFRFKGVAKEAAFVVRASLGEGRTLEALARAGAGEAAVTPASTVALAVARSRVTGLAAVTQATYERLTTELEAGLVRDDALIDLAKPLDSYARVAAERPAVVEAADALEAAARLAPAAGGARPAKVAGATLFATLPETPSALRTVGDQTYAVLPVSRTAMSDVGGQMKEIATFPFAPSAASGMGTTLYVWDRAGGRFARYAVKWDAAKPMLVADGERKFPMSPTPAITRMAVDADGIILTDGSDFRLQVNGQPLLRLPVVGGLSISGIPGGVRGAAASGPATFWLGTAVAEGNLYQMGAHGPIGTPVTIPHAIQDVALGPDGTVYVATGAATDGLYRVKEGVATSMGFPLAVDLVAVTQDGRLRAAVGDALYFW